MKIGKYPVKHSYKIPRLISDVFSVGLAVFICSVEIMFITVYEDTLTRYIGEGQLEILAQTDSSIGWRHWLTLVFPALVVAVFAAYIVLVLKSHRFKGLNVTKRTAQKVYDMYAMCVSLCKIPALMLISEMMMITHNKLLMSDESWFTIQLVLDALIIFMLVIFFRRMLQRVTEPEQTADDNVIKVRAVVKSEEPESADDNNDTERS
ncbi:MAG: hypothetical protein ACI4WS_03720 [Oscillospiraceae bacterium]